MKEVRRKRKVSRSRRLYNRAVYYLGSAVNALRVASVFYNWGFLALLILVPLGVEMFTPISIRDSYLVTRSPDYMPGNDPVVDTIHALRLTVPEIKSDFQSYRLSEIKGHSVHSSDDPRFATPNGYLRAVRDVKFGNAFALTLYFGFVLWCASLLGQVIFQVARWSSDNSFCWESLVPRREVGLPTPRPHVYDREPSEFHVRRPLVRRGRKVFERGQSFADIFEQNRGFISLGGSGCLVGCLVIVWPLGVLWIVAYAVVAIVSAIEFKSGYKYVCTRSEYDYWVRAVEARRAKCEAEEKENIARREREREQARRNKIRAEQNAIQAKELARVRAEKAKLERLARLRLDNWLPEPTEQFVRHLPPEWWPLKTVGLAYANVVPYSSPPPGQRYIPQEGRWTTIGKQESALRGVYLLGTTAQRTMNKNPLVVGPDKLRGTTSQDLVMFVVDASGEVKYLGNPARFEIYSAPSDDEEASKLEKLKPVLAALYNQVLSSGPGSSGWV